MVTKKRIPKKKIQKKSKNAKMMINNSVKKSNKIFALKTNVEHWSSKKMKLIDKLLTSKKVNLLDIAWANCELLKNDKNHFTWRGLKNFVDLLLNKCLFYGIYNIHIISDSTIAWWNYDNDGNFTNAASNLVVDEFRKKGIKATIQAINGTGFKRRYEEDLDFASLLKNNDSNFKNTNILIVGGWNDEVHNNIEIKEGIEKFMNIYKIKKC